MKIPNLKIADVKGEVIFECYHCGRNGSGVFGAKRLFSGIYELCESFSKHV